MTQRRNRAENRRHMESEILRLAKSQLEERNPADLSLREIAREMSVASSAIYRYVHDRDELLTLLLIDAYTELADTVEDALESSPQEPRVPSAPRDLRTFARTMRSWALENPARWGLIYGTPVPGYAAPAESTVAPGTRLLAVLAHIVAAGTPAGAEPSRAYADFLDEGINDLLPPLSYLNPEGGGEDASEGGGENSSDGGGVDASVQRRELARWHAATTVDVWCALLGTISAEVFGQLGPGLEKTNGEILERLLEAWTAKLFPSTEPDTEQGRR